MLFLAGQKKEQNLKDTVCFDGGVCSDEETCCFSATGKYACCPLKNAVCCNDNIHCCPSGYSCNTGQGTCIKSGSHPMLSLL